MVKAIIFDYFGVISSDEYWNFVKTNKNFSSDFLDIANKVNLGKLSWQEFMKTVAQRTGKTYDEVKSMYERERINPQVIELIHELKTKFKIGLITNAHHEFLEPILTEMGLTKLFDSIVISSLVGHIKPDPEIFQHAINELGVKPEEAVFIDDIERNAAAAEEIGLQSIHYQSFGTLKTELARIL